MTIEKLMELRESNDAPFDHQAYTVWLHNKIIQDINNEIIELHSEGKLKGSYNGCSAIISLPSLQPIK